jgi:hypothetical protein
MWFPGEQWQCPGCTGFTSQYTRLEFLDSYDARFVIVTQGPIDEALAYKRLVGNKMTWYSTANSPFGADVGAPPGGGFAVVAGLPGWLAAVAHLQPVERLAGHRRGVRSARARVEARAPAPGLRREGATKERTSDEGGGRGPERAEASAGDGDTPLTWASSGPAC